MQHIPENGTAHLKKQQRERRDCLLKTTWKNRCTAGFFSSFIRVFFPFDRGKQYYGSINRADRE